MRDPKQLALLEAMLLEAERLKFGTLHVEILQHFEVEVRDGRVTSWKLSERPRMNIEQIVKAG